MKKKIKAPTIEHLQRTLTLYANALNGRAAVARRLGNEKGTLGPADKWTFVAGGVKYLRDQSIADGVCEELALGAWNALLSCTPLRLPEGAELRVVGGKAVLWL